MQDTKSQIIEIARDLFAEYGFDGVSVRAICNKAGCNVSAISYYFGSKEELFHATIIAGAEVKVKAAESILTPPESTEDFKVKLKIFLNQFYDSSIEHTATIRIISRDMKIIKENANVQAYFQKIPEAMTNFFALAQEQNIIRKDFNPRALVDFIISPYFMHVLFSDVNTDFDLKDPDFRQSLVDQHLELLYKGFLV
ncbi:MAG: TetR family transcriptional regulator [Bacteriovoracaceae bacterium]